MTGKYVLKNSKTGKFSFNLVADNDQVLMTSETYESKAAARNGIALVKASATSAVEDSTQ